jgi:hypothetical protein
MAGHRLSPTFRCATSARRALVAKQRSTREKAPTPLWGFFMFTRLDHYLDTWLHMIASGRFSDGLQCTERKTP